MGKPGSLRPWWPIAALVVLLISALILGRGTTPRSAAARVESIASGIKCPTCQGLSVAQSKASSARAIYREITRQVADGASDSDVRAYLVSRYGKGQLLRPNASGLGSVVWIAPVALTLLGMAGVLVALRKWRPTGVTATDEDRALVAEALSEASSAAPEPSAPSDPRP